MPGPSRTRADGPEEHDPRPLVEAALRALPRQAGLADAAYEDLISGWLEYFHRLYRAYLDRPKLPPALQDIGRSRVLEEVERVASLLDNIVQVLDTLARPTRLVFDLFCSDKPDALIERVFDERLRSISFADKIEPADTVDNITSFLREMATALRAADLSFLPQTAMRQDHYAGFAVAGAAYVFLAITGKQPRGPGRDEKTGEWKGEFYGFFAEIHKALRLQGVPVTAVRKMARAVRQQPLKPYRVSPGFEP